MPVLSVKNITDVFDIMMYNFKEAQGLCVPVSIAIVVLCSFQLKALADLFPFILIAGITCGCMILSRPSYFCQSYLHLPS